MRKGLDYFRALLLASAIMVANVLAAQPKSNKPNTSSQPQAADTINPTPGSYSFCGYCSNLNSISIREAKGAIPNDSLFNIAGYADVKELTTYIDGLSRPMQTVSKQITRGITPKDIVVPMIYDEFGRERFKYLPYASDSNNGSFKVNPFAEQAAFYQNTSVNPEFTGEQVFYTQTEFEHSPLNRILKVSPPGNYLAGNGRGIQRRYLTNIGSDSVCIWNITENPLTYSVADSAVNIPSTSAYYNAGQLFKNIIVDEDGNGVVEFSDKDGKLVLRKVQIGVIDSNYCGYSGFLSTYYIYDNFNNLRFIIQPKGVDQIKGNWLLSTSVVNELCFRYEYDSRQRIIAKKIPGAGWVYNVYDMRDRLVFSQDANLRAASKWLTTLYDVLNRPVITGMISFGYYRDSLQHFVDGSSNSVSTLISNVITAPSVSTDATFSFRENGRQSYQATNSITISNGFESELTADFTMEIVVGNGSTSFADTTNIYNNPLPPNNEMVTLTITYYDNYSWTSKSYNTVNNSKLSAGSNVHAEEIPLTGSKLTNGLVTGTRVRVLENLSNLVNSPLLTTVNFYDDRSRLSQVISENYKGGTDICTNLYDFEGKILSKYQVLSNQPAGQPNLRIQTNMQYDPGSRLIETWKIVNDDTLRKTLIADYDYDQLDQLKTKRLGKFRDNNGNYINDPLEILDYTYNLRGWVRSINKDYANHSGTNGNNRWFGIELNYEWGFDSARYNGNLSGVKWRAKGDGEKRAYGFTYDRANRILGADFSQANASNSYIDNATVNFDMVTGDGQNSATTYDANGNINYMRHWGLKVQGSSLIDSLTYSYQSQTNKLIKVSDGITMDNKLDDFKDGNNGSTDDYTYDYNGNMILDRNKGLSIVYDHLNMPNTLLISGKGKITYIYDATGIKLRKSIIDSTISPPKVTSFDYVNGAVYENDVLGFIGHEEGRIRKSDSTFVYDYFIKDYLGNVRAVLTDEQKKDAYPVASLETENLPVEKTFYFGLDSGRVEKANVGGYPSDSYTNPNAYIQQLNGNGPKVGSGIILKVMAGDKFNIRANSWYKKNGASPNSPADPFSNILIALSQGVAGVSSGKATSSELFSNSLFNSNITDFLQDQTYISSRPKAYLNWILLDEQFKYDSSGSGFEQVGEDTMFTTHLKNNLAIEKNGYLCVFMSNVTPNISVYFDNLQVTHLRGPLLEETQYYPFGLIMKGISSKALSFGKPNRLLYNGYEKQNDEFSTDGLNWYDYKYRFYDNQIGRFFVQDQLAEEYVYYTPYQFAGNEVPNGIDLDGLQVYRSGTQRYGTSPTSYYNYRRAYRQINAYIPNVTAYRNSGIYIPNQAAGSAATPANIYLPRDNNTDPTITRGRGSTLAQLVVKGTEMSSAIKDQIESVTISSDNYPTDGGGWKMTARTVSVVFKTKEAEAEFNKQVAEYNKKVKAIYDRNQVAPLGNRATDKEKEAYAKKVYDAGLLIGLQITFLGPSPWEKIVAEVQKNAKVTEEIKTLPTITPWNPNGNE